jgi:Ubiquitin carboxyl-terminal hydrolase
MELEKQYFNPKHFCKAFKEIDGSPIDPFQQKDVDEFFFLLMDRLETQTKGTPQEKLIKNLFQGTLANECICIDCPHRSENEEPFLGVSLTVKNMPSLEDSLRAYVEGEMLEGDNAYFCEKCEKKVNTLKRCCIKRLPNTLFLVLKRFEFNFDTMQKEKLNDYCQFPADLDMQPYSQQALAREDLLKKMEAQNLAAEDLNEEELLVLKRKIPESYYQYKLKGIVVHFGTAD